MFNIEIGRFQYLLKLKFLFIFQEFIFVIDQDFNTPANNLL